MATNNLPNKFSDEEIQLERQHQEFIDRHEKDDEIFDLNDCHELDVGVVFDLLIKLKGAVFYKQVASGFEFYDKDMVYMKCLSVKHDNENVQSLIRTMNLKKEV